MAFFQWWATLSPRVRFAVALVPLALSTLLWLTGRFWPWGWVAGAVMLAFSFPSQAQKRGYHDF